MIYIKDKGNRTQIYIPRNGEVGAGYATQGELNELSKKVDRLYDKVVGEYATKSYVDGLVGNINNRLEEILN
jgi:hypothetical protein